MQGEAEVSTDNRPVGRPRTTIDDLPAGWKEIIMDCGQSGGSEVKMRCLLGIGDSAWYTLLKDSVEFRKTVKTAKDLCQVWWEDAGQNMAVTGDGNATSWIFNMKNRFNWHDRQQVDHTSSDGSQAPSRIEIVAPSMEAKKE